MSNLVLFLIFIFSTQSISEDPQPQKKKKRPTIHRAPFVKIYGKSKIYR